jgi:hypothetical protein
MNWELQLAGSHMFRAWSFGSVAKETDLYSQKIFGPTKDLSCQCGKYSGDPKYAGIICDACGVIFAEDAASLRRVRLGHLVLACPCIHPMSKGTDIIHDFPIAPIACRTTDDGMPNVLGGKYEALIRENLAAEQEMPDRDSKDYYPACMEFDRSPLEGTLRSVVGAPDHVSGSVIPSPDEADSLLSRLFVALAEMDSATPALMRAMGCMIRIEGTV